MMTEPDVCEHFADVLRSIASQIENQTERELSYSRSKNTDNSYGDRVLVRSQEYTYHVGLEDGTDLEIKMTTPPTNREWLPKMKVEDENNE